MQRKDRRRKLLRGARGGAALALLVGAPAAAQTVPAFQLSAGNISLVTSQAPDPANNCSATQTVYNSATQAAGFANGVVACVAGISSPGTVISGPTSDSAGTVTIANSANIVATTANAPGAAGIVGLSIGGTPDVATLSGVPAPGAGGAVIINNTGSISAVPGTATPPTTFVSGQNFGFFVLPFGGAVAGVSFGGQGTGGFASNSQSGAATTQVTGGAAGDVTIANGIDASGNQSFVNISTGASVTVPAAGSFQAQPSINAGLLGVSLGGDAANDWGIGIGQGGAGGAVSITTLGNITTIADTSPGVLAFSAGGGGSVAAGSQGGGSGGAVGVSFLAYQGNTGGSISTSGGTAPGILAISAGGNIIGSEEQGNGGAGGPVTVNVASPNQIVTSGAFSAGIIAGSLSGGATTGVPQSRLFFNAPGSGGAVMVTSNATIVTQGPGSDGIVAQSVGGAGGTQQASNVTSSFTLGFGTSNVSTASLVTVNHGGSITVGAAGMSSGTLADSQNPDLAANGIGILAQSIVGGGGIAYLVNTAEGATVNLGAPSGGGNASAAGGVTVTNTGAITTWQAGGTGILAQSIGGGGGNAKSVSGLFRVGGNGGEGGTGGAVTVVTSGSILANGWQAQGIVAQSLGGGGGSGSTVRSAFSAVGGSGGGGGAGNTVQVTAEAGGSIRTTGDDSAAIVAQSIGGGGGLGGKASAWGIIASAAVGGSGGDGGPGGAVTVTASGTIATGTATTVGSNIFTTGAHAFGILAQSVGGGGGAAGAAFSTQAGSPFAMSVAVGGTGGIGGDGGPVSVAFGGSGPGQLSTIGPDGHAIVAQSIGGGGGAGGQSRARSWGLVSTTAMPSLQIATAVGGAGGVAGTAQGVTVTTAAPITTSGIGAMGILAQSIGGGGGAGGDSTALATTLFATGSAAISVPVSVGGRGGAGGDGGAVAVTLGGSLSTIGDGAHGIVAQSIGGGGGTGSIGNSAALPTLGTGTPATVAFAVGGDAAGAGAGNTVNVSTTAAMQTQGLQAHGILAQSIGGGGGVANGGLVNGSTSVGTGSASYALTATIGARGGAGGSGGAVTVNAGAGIATSGASSIGILAQSIGGGGGAGGTAAPPPAENWLAALANQANQIYGFGTVAQAALVQGKFPSIISLTSFTANLSIGGRGGASGDGGSVTINQTAGVISTSGLQAHGIVAQSIGGGGGIGGASSTTSSTSTLTAPLSASLDVALGGAGSSGGTGGQVTVNLGTAGQPGQTGVSTTGASAHGLLAQSIGGGGGLAESGGVQSAGVMTLGFAQSGDGGGGGAGGTVNVTNYSAVQTAGDGALGMLVQSIGGGGGASSPPTLTTGAGPISFRLGATFSGSEGSGATGGAVTIAHNAGLTTSGPRAIGILAQSIGGGGGYAPTLYGQTAPVSLVAAGSGAASGGAVSVSLGPGGFVATGGAGAHGVIAQSIGGGGGVAGNMGQPTVFGLASGTVSSTANGHGGAVTVQVNGGTVSTTGANAHGIIAQSLGGGGGIFGGNMGASGVKGTAGPVTVNIVGGSVSSAQGYGILAQSVGATAGGAVQLSITGGAQVSGGLAGVAIDTSGASGSAAATLTIGRGSALCGTSCSTNTGSPVTLVNPSSQVLVTTSGLIAGTFQTEGAQVLAQLGGTLRLSGTNILGGLTMTPGSTLDLQTFGSFAGVTLQTPGGSLVLDRATILMPVDFLNQQSNRLTLIGNYGVFGVKLGISPTNLYPVSTPIEVIASQGVNIGSETLANGVSVANSDLVYSFSLVNQTIQQANTLGVTVAADFTPASVALTGNQSQVAAAVQSSWNTDAAGQPNSSTPQQRAVVYSGLYGQSASSYGTALGNLQSQTPGAQVANSLSSGAALANTLQSCPDFAGPETLLRENTCLWARVIGRLGDTGRTQFGSSSSASAVAFQIGGQYEFAPNWFIGAVFSEEQAWLRASAGNERATLRGQSLGVTLKRQIGTWQVSASALAGYASGDARRSLPAFGASATSSPGGDMQIGRLRVSREFVGEAVYVKPAVNFDVIRLGAWGYTEQGAGAFGLRVAGSSHVQFAVTPQVELGGRWNLSENTVLRPNVTLGATFQSESSYETRQYLLGQQMRIRSPLAGTIGTLSLGMDLTHSRGFQMRAQYVLDASANMTAHTGMLRAGYRF
jgi:hypothetical protein